VVAVKKPRPDRKQRLTAGQRLCPHFVMGSNIDATTPAGRMMMQMVSGAEMARVYSIKLRGALWTCRIRAGAVGRASFPPQYRSLSICRD
jgi:hypothetical protein